jgi:hypothetical protein
VSELIDKSRPDWGTWREGARSKHPDDICPGCGHVGVLFASDFRKFGRHSIRACDRCRTVYHNGERSDRLDIFETHPA